MRRLRQWLQPPHRLRFTRAGVILTGAIIVLGFAALNTGNNLLYLVLGGLLGLIMVSGWLSEQALRGLHVRRRVPRAGVAGDPIRIAYHVTNQKTRFPSLAVQLIESGLDESIFISVAWPGKTAVARGSVVVARRGVYRLDHVTLRTTFPYGLFVKERDVRIPSALMVWPRFDRKVRPPRRGAEHTRRSGLALALAAGTGRGEYRSLRPYVRGDDPRDVHWRSSARRGQPLVREYEQEATNTLWLCLELRAPESEQAESLVEIAASLAARAAREQERFGLATNDDVVAPGTGEGHLEAVLNTLARVRFRTDAPTLNLPTAPAGCVLLTPVGVNDGRFADYYTAADA